MTKPRLVVFASGTKDGGGSGFENLVRAARETDELDADIVAVVSNHEHGSVRERADRLGVPFLYMEGPWDAEGYARIARETAGEWFALSGWLKRVEGLDPARTFNIHPALLSSGRFGGAGMYGHRIHESVAAAFAAGDIAESGPTMHFTTGEYDRGPAFFEFRVPLSPGMTADDIAKAVNAVEHEWQPRITDLVVHGRIAWDGADAATLRVPDGYAHLPRR